MLLGIEDFIGLYIHTHAKHSGAFPLYSPNNNEESNFL